MTEVAPVVEPAASEPRHDPLSAVPLDSLTLLLSSQALRSTPRLRFICRRRWKTHSRHFLFAPLQECQRINPQLNFLKCEKQSCTTAGVCVLGGGDHSSESQRPFVHLNRDKYRTFQFQSEAAIDLSVLLLLG